MSDKEMEMVCGTLLTNKGRHVARVCVDRGVVIMIMEAKTDMGKYVRLTRWNAMKHAGRVLLACVGIEA